MTRQYACVVTIRMTRAKAVNVSLKVALDFYLQARQMSCGNADAALVGICPEMPGDLVILCYTGIDSAEVFSPGAEIDVFINILARIQSSITVNFSFESCKVSFVVCVAYNFRNYSAQIF